MSEEKKSSAEKMPPPPAPADVESGEDGLVKPLSPAEKVQIEREQEQKLKAKYPQAARPMPAAPGGGGHSAFLQKRLAKGQKYFDSGDYNMAKQKGPGGRPGMGRLAIPVLAGGGPAPPTGDTIPTPDNVPARKTSIIQPLHDHSQSMHLASDPAHAPPPPPPGQPMPNPAITKLAS